MKSSTVWHGNLPHGRQSRLIIPPAKRNRAFPTGNALLYISLLYADLIASFTSSAILNDLFAMAGCVLFRAHPVFVSIFTIT